MLSKYILLFFHGITLLLLTCLSDGRLQVKDYYATRRTRLVRTATKSNPTYFTVCWLLEDDSYYSSYGRLAAAVDLAIMNANAYVLPETVKFKLVYQSVGLSCTATQYTAISNVFRMMGNGVSCDVFVGAGCPTTAVALYGIAYYLDIPIFGCPSAGTASLSLTTEVDNQFPLLIKAAFGFTDEALFLNLFLARYRYTNLWIFRDDSYNFFTLFSRFVVSKLQALNPQLLFTVTQQGILSSESNITQYKELLRKANEFTRVILILAHGDAVRQIMIAAWQMGFTKGEYLFLAVELFELKYWGSIQSEKGDRYDEAARDAFKTLLVLSLRKGVPNGDTLAFEQRVKLRAKETYNYTFRPLETMDVTILAHYESILIYAQEAAAMIGSGYDVLDGSVVVKRIFGSQYEGISGPVKIGYDGERDNDLELKAFDSAGLRSFEPVLEYLSSNFTDSVLVQLKNFYWPSVNGQLPPNEPKCGYRGEKCLADLLSKDYLAAAIVIPLLFVTGFATTGIVFFLRFRKLKKNYDPFWWRIISDELAIQQNRTASTASRKTAGSQEHRSQPRMDLSELVALYNGNLVSLTDVTEFKRHPSSEMVNAFGLLKGCTSPNLQKFIGVGLTNTGMCEYIVNELCAKGSLTDVLASEVIKLDCNFKNNLIKDIVFGMTYLHTTPIRSHGNLNSHTCLIDARFTLKIGDYGLHFFRNSDDLKPPRPTDNERVYQLLLWRAPELLRRTMPPEGTQKGDVYSFAIILQQLILRSGPFELPIDPLELSDKEIVMEVFAANIPPVRPRVPRASCSNELYNLMEQCWSETPMERPSFFKIKESMKKVIGDVDNNIVDLLFKRMEQYAADLEFKVAEKTQQFMEEKTRSEELLSQLLPKPVAAALTKGEHVEPEAFQSVSIFFSDIVGFTTISAAGSPMDVVSLLNSLYTFFDGILEKYDVYKVETIGDAYMVSSGLPERNGNRHAAEIACMALDLVKGIKLLTVPNRPNVAIEIRAGINSGAAVAGVVGTKMPRYCVFGDTVNVASRMESTGEPMKIQITSPTRDLLISIGGFFTEDRGPVAVKGKGTLHTYWLTRVDYRNISGFVEPSDA